MRFRRAVTFTVALAAAAAALTACSSSPSIEVTEETVVIDVRTPGEYAGGHLEGAVNVNLQSPTFQEDILEYDLDGEYVVYCQSGNRSSQAVAYMDQAGFEDVTDAGGVSEASKSTGLDIVTD
ncbi:rhodanese-like domain-containing protein [Microbacterium thalassium]|uniref:Rhodanese-related sulfurtransferase n=1 Tax=Microbacterium thalassium TaxID=362649 RepID=A0A7X0KVM9_9MICO|nr:rhodanese-like domain-containing protein [Microbacterium thalassium]MBB6392239.1 rhodanese-related sulfurtransferase [Microbacterium thalassium]GLK23450.1 hypothetical protein GCM10017607_07680 [Microbacterium thalassium]